MIPEGLMLLTRCGIYCRSSKILARKSGISTGGLLSETLARVDVICLDIKTGTITDGTLKLEEALLKKFLIIAWNAIMGALNTNQLKDQNATAKSVTRSFPSCCC